MQEDRPRPQSLTVARAPTRGPCNDRGPCGVYRGDRFDHTPWRTHHDREDRVSLLQSRPVQVRTAPHRGRVLLRPDLQVPARLCLSPLLRLRGGSSEEGLTGLPLPFDATSSARWNEILRAHRGELRGFLRRRLSSDAEADELLAMTLARAWEKSAALGDPTRARAWLFAVARTSLDSYRKSERRRLAHLAPDAAIDDVADLPVRAAGCCCSLVRMAELPPAYASLLRSVDVDGESLSDVARELGITTNNATVRLSRARSALRARLEAHCGTTSAEQCMRCGCDERSCCQPDVGRSARVFEPDPPK